MKKIKLVSICILSALFFLTSCDKDDDNTTEDKNVAIGKYTGVLVGSSGAYKVSLTESGATATILFDDIKYNLSSSKPLKKGQSITLTKGSVSMEISVDDKGENPTIAFKIPGHSIVATINQILKENSIELYQGTLTVKYSKNGGPFFVEKKETLNYSFTKNNFICLEVDKKTVSKEKGIVITRTPSHISIKTTHSNSGGNTEFNKLDLEDQNASKITFRIQGNQLIYNRIKKDEKIEYELNKIIL